MRGVLSIILILLLAIFVQGNSQSCVDGKDNVLVIETGNDTSKGPFSLSNLRFAVYDTKKKPSCPPRITFPGFVRLLSGHVVKRQPLDPMISMKLSAKHNSVMIGEVCKSGKSQNYFVPDESCTINICYTMPDFCNWFNDAEDELDIEELPESARSIQRIGSIDNSYLDGEWKISAELVYKNEGFIDVKISNPSSQWIRVRVEIDEHSGKNEL